MPSATTIQFTREEQLELENLELHMRLLQMEQARLLGLKKDWSRRIKEKHGADIEGWFIDPQKGVATDPTSVTKASA